MSKNHIAIYNSKVDNPKITIAIPTYKRSDLLYEAIMSAINQKTTIQYDVIVVDNNPERNDETERMMKQFEDHPLVSYYKNTSNLGMVGNWNQLFHLAAGQWVSMLHDDDLLFSYYLHYVNKAVNVLKNPEVIISKRVTSSNREIKNAINSNFIKYRNITPELFILGNIIGPPVGMCVRKAFFFKTNGFRQEMYPSIDFDFYITSSQKGNVYELKNPLCLYYIGDNESLKEETITGFFQDAKRFSNRLTKELKFPYNLINKVCYWWIIKDVARWTMSFSNDKVIIGALNKIHYKRNKLLEGVSTLIAKTLQRIFNYKSKVYSIDL